MVNRCVHARGNSHMHTCARMTPLAPDGLFKGSLFPFALLMDLQLYPVSWLILHVLPLVTWHVLDLTLDSVSVLLFTLDPAPFLTFASPALYTAVCSSLQSPDKPPIQNHQCTWSAPLVWTSSPNTTSVPALLVQQSPWSPIPCCRFCNQHQDKGKQRAAFSP